MAYYIFLHNESYLRDDSVGLTSSMPLPNNAFTINYSDRKIYSTESAATTVMNSLGAAPESIKVVKE